MLVNRNLKLHTQYNQSKQDLYSIPNEYLNFNVKLKAIVSFIRFCKFLIYNLKDLFAHVVYSLDSISSDLYRNYCYNIEICGKHWNTGSRKICNIILKLLLS